MLLEELHHPCTESSNDNPDDKPRDPEGGKYQNEAMIVQFCSGGRDRESFAHEEHRAIVLEDTIVMRELVDCISMLDRKCH
jgi:hypothetical protein